MNAADRRIALITGANKGIGLEVARQLGKAGHHILLGARDEARGRAAEKALRDEGIAVRFVAIDLADSASLAAAAADIEAHEGRIDILVNNAGIAVQGDGLPGTTDLDVVRRTFETNFFGNVAVTQALLPLVKKSRAGRIVNVSSGLGSIALNADPNWDYAAVKLIGYNGSKAALNMFTVLLAAELKDSGIKVNAVNPGYTATDLNGNSGHQSIEEGAAETVRMAQIPDDGPTGGFTSTEGVEPW
ncbi:NAD(P)-dependent dehydrogenase (short-subunit alcohol dehydrogenase family) [Rhodanobacter sp. K2T2]|uniref:SDR family oxidoreductase n=1 Tax=Rhodanobacter sp. K2T2 TaxID=2723085 RepID=UPI0015C79C65|nr:SDR family oxidoreductase [Rhodanobacter sp. K2T2]NYE30376.1 NAD(P)-dependent dehydrogenase (short-subunit alcohol dehydrogenase family) [Rhodanobacter sp. K2T2]